MVKSLTYFQHLCHYHIPTHLHHLYPSPSSIPTSSPRYHHSHPNTANISQQRALEKLHGDFLLQFGPAGLKTVWKHPLVAPLYRDNGNHSQDADEEPWKTADEVKIPRSLLESAALLLKVESAVEHNTSLPFTSFEDLLHLDSDTDVENDEGKKVKKLVTSNGSFITLPTSPPRPNYTSTPVSSARGHQNDHQTLHDVDIQHGPTYASHGRRTIKIKKHDSPTTTVSSNNSPPLADYSLRHVAGPNDIMQDEEEDEHPPLWIQPAWQEWHEYPSNSSAGIRAIGQALLAETPSDTNVPSIHITQPRTGNFHGEEAAETLLDLHSTPARGGEPDRSPTPELLDAALLAHARLAIQEEEERGRGGNRPRSMTVQKNENWMNGIPDLIKNYSSFSSVSSRPDDSRPKQQFLSRPGIMQRSLSTTILDDPFVLDSSTPQAKSNTSNTRNHPALTGSPVRNASGSKRKDIPASPIRMRAPLNPITNRAQGSNTIFTNSPKKGTNTNYQTPLRPSRTAGSNAPATGGYGWMQFSSPVDPAASLGLAPTHAVPTTPGLSMIIGQDTPAGGKRGRMTPRIR
jgi:hypothetical protein